LPVIGNDSGVGEVTVMIRVVVCGAGGRMGMEVARVLAEQSDIELVGGVERVDHPAVGTALGKGTIVSDLAQVLDKADVVVDFTVPAVTCAHAELCAQAGKPFLSGVTGLTEDQTAILKACSHGIPLLHAPNFSVGVAVLRRLVEQAAKALTRGFDVEIVEVHHRRKKDAPSGTAKLLFETVRQARAESSACYSRAGQNGQKPECQVGVSSVRTGDVVGEHTVIFGGPGERVELAHKAESRLAFASGVLAAVRFIKGRKPGLYSLDSILAG